MNKEHTMSANKDCLCNHQHDSCVEYLPSKPYQYDNSLFDVIKSMPTAERTLDRLFTLHLACLYREAC